MSRANLIRIGLIGVLVLALLLLLRMHGAAAQAQDLVGDVAAGRRLVAAWCSECHALVSGTAAGKGGPAFTAIANMPSTTALSLRVFLQSSHRTMPNLIIGRTETDDLIAYILSLKAKP
jgi:mono/diheme cytochrome c family protein